MIDALRTTARRILPGAAALLLLVATACPSNRRPPDETPAPSAWREWPATLAASRRLADAGRFAAADSLLATFGDRWRGLPEEEESLYWRIMLRLDPLNQTASMQDAIAQIDDYLARSPSATRRDELLILRRAALLTQRLYAENANLKIEREKAGDPAKKEEELQKLRDDLAKSQAELERVRKRVRGRRP